MLHCTLGIRGATRTRTRAPTHERACVRVRARGNREVPHCADHSSNIPALYHVKSATPLQHMQPRQCIRGNATLYGSGDALARPLVINGWRALLRLPRPRSCYAAANANCQRAKKNAAAHAPAPPGSTLAGTKRDSLCHILRHKRMRNIKATQDGECLNARTLARPRSLNARMQNAHTSFGCC